MNLTSILGTQGLIAKRIDGFQPRQAQLDMAESVFEAIQSHTHLVVEAGTGIGKTFAYMAPVFLSAKKTIISTGTKNLQDQLFLKDIPALKEAMGFAGQIMLLKGRANYLCIYRLEKNRFDGRFASKHLIEELEEIYKWSFITKQGDKSEIDTVPEDSAIWPYVTSTVENCLNQECEFYKKCFVVKARQKALDADVLIVNHHLFFADMVLQQDGFGELLPLADVVVFDEAHQVPEIASNFFSKSFSSRRIYELVRDLEIEIRASAAEALHVLELTRDLIYFVNELKNALGSISKRYAWPNPVPSELSAAITKICDYLSVLDEQIKPLAIKTKALENISQRVAQIIRDFHELTGTDTPNAIHWYELFEQSFVIQQTPIVITEEFKDLLTRKERALIFTSATLTIDGRFNHFLDALGLKNVTEQLLESPFDYQNQALLYVPRGLPDARTFHYTSAVTQAILPVLEMMQGKTFVLFTSHKAMKEVYDVLKECTDLPLLIQGSAPKNELLSTFKKLGNAVLLGTSSFWYGVDVRGRALSCVIIDKLPFVAPDDPILSARLQSLKKQGKDPFQAYQLPNAILTLKQGVGRLIRDINDKGLLVICDPRLVGFRYGETFLKSLPNIPRTRNLERVKQFNETISN